MKAGVVVGGVRSRSAWNVCALLVLLWLVGVAVTLGVTVLGPYLCHISD
jgi:hypothetical protein